jgi:hypothetical protein
MSPLSTHPESVLAGDPSQGAPSGHSRSKVLFARILIGLIVLICAEVFSGASLQKGLWHPWTVLVTYWLYFAHFFFLTTLAVRTGRTSLSALYLWGVLFGLYESWITKVIWYGYSGDGKFAMGHIGPYGFSELSMVFIFHPVVSFIVPLAVTCLLCPPLRRLFPELAWFSGKSRGARVVQAYLVFSFAPMMAFNSGGPINLTINLVVAIILLLVLIQLAQPALDASDGRPIVVFGRRGFGGLCVYLVFLYGVGYVVLRPEGRPSVTVQLFTFVFYAFAVAGLRILRKREPLAEAPVEKRELRPASPLGTELRRGISCCAQVAQAQGVMAFGQADSLFVRHQRAMIELGSRHPERSIQQQLPGCGREQIGAAHHFGDPHRRVVHHDGKLVSRNPIVPPDDEIAEVLARDELLRPALAVSERNPLAIRHAETPVPLEGRAA